MKTGKLFIWLGLALTAICSYVVAQTSFTFSDHAFLASLKLGAGGAETGNPGTNGLIAWYDFADTNNAFNGLYGWVETNSPTYTGGSPDYATSTENPTNHWWNTDLPTVFANAAGDWSFSIRFRVHPSVANSDYILIGNNGSTVIRWYTTGTNYFRVALGTGTVYCTNLWTTNVWYNITTVHDTDTTTTEVFIDDTSYGTASANSFSSLRYFLGASSMDNSERVDFDFFNFWARELTADEISWFYNGGDTRNFSDVVP